MQIQLDIKIVNICANALLDLKAIKNFIDEKFVQKYKISTIRKKRSYSLKSLSDNLIIFRVKDKTRSINIKIKEHQKEIIFNITKLKERDLILEFF
jgi:hypothetical protein